MDNCGYLLGFGDVAIILKKNSKLSFGRSKVNDYPIKDFLLSRCHTQINVNASGVASLSDLNSSNHTYLNGKELTPHTAEILNDGDRIRMGNQMLTFQLQYGDKKNIMSEPFKAAPRYSMNLKLPDPVEPSAPIPNKSPSKISWTKMLLESDSKTEISCPDCVVINFGEGTRTLDIKEWFALSKEERIEILQQKGATFMAKGKAIPIYEAMAELRKFRNATLS